MASSDTACHPLGRRDGCCHIFPPIVGRQTQYVVPGGQCHPPVGVNVHPAETILRRTVCSVVGTASVSFSGGDHSSIACLHLFVIIAIPQR